MKKKIKAKSVKKPKSKTPAAKKRPAKPIKPRSTQPGSKTAAPINSPAKVADILSILEEHFPSVEPPLHHKDAYTLLISVLLAAQCTDERVNKTTPILFAKADNPTDMIKMTADEIREIIKPCGLSPMKSKGIYGLSKILLEKHGGQVPSTFEDLEALPAVGHKTASVVMTQWFHKPAFPVDTHVHRLAFRWGLSEGNSVEQTERDLKQLIPEEKWDKVHLQMIYFGRKYCPARQHKWEECPVCRKYLRVELRD